MDEEKPAIELVVKWRERVTRPRSWTRNVDSKTAIGKALQRRVDAAESEEAPITPMIDLHQ